MLLKKIHQISNSPTLSITDHPRAKRKTALGPMLILAAIAYAAAGVTFVVLAVQASQNTTVETVIQDHDVSGKIMRKACTTHA